MLFDHPVLELALIFFKISHMEYFNANALERIIPFRRKKIPILTCGHAAAKDEPIKLSSTADVVQRLIPLTQVRLYVVAAPV
jgi:hypothetical protein